MPPTAKYVSLGHDEGDEKGVADTEASAAAAAAEESTAAAAPATVSDAETDLGRTQPPPAAPSEKRRYLHLQVPAAHSRFKRFVLGLARPPNSPRKTPVEAMAEAKQHKEAIKSLLDEFVKQQDALNPRLGRRASEGKQALAALAEDGARAGSDAAAAAAADKGKQERQAERFLVLFSRSLLLYGCPTHVTEYHGEQVARGLGLQKAHFVIMPTFTLVAFNRGDSGEGLGGNTVMFRSSPGIDMYRLQLVDEIARRVASYASLEPPAGNMRDTLQEIKAAIKPGLNSTVLKVQEALPGSAASLTGGAMVLSHRVEPGEPHERPLRCEPDLKSFGSDPASKKNIAPRAAAAISQQSEKTGWISQQQAAISNLKEMILTLSTFGPGFLLENARWRRRKGLPKADSNQSVYEEVFARLALEDANNRLQLVVNMAPLYPASLYPLLNAVVSGGGSLLYFSGGWWDLPVTFVIGFLIGTMRYFTKENNFSRIYEFCSSLIIGFVARLLLHLDIPICFSATCLSCAIFLIQGLGITMSMSEILTRNMIMGVSRLGFSLLITAMIGYGLDLGAVLAEYTFVMPKIVISAQCPTPVDTVFLYVIFPPTMLALNLRFNSHKSQLPAMMAMQAIAFSVSGLLRPIMGVNLAAGFAALAAGVASNAYARLSGNPPIVYIIAAMLVLVPGAMAVMGFSSVLSVSAIENTGVSLATTVLLSSISISIALFAANLVSPQTELNALARAKRGKFNTLGF